MFVCIAGYALLVCEQTSLPNQAVRYLQSLRQSHGRKVIEKSCRASQALWQEMLVHFRSYESASMPDVARGSQIASEVLCEVHAAGIPFYAGQAGRRLKAA